MNFIKLTVVSRMFDEIVRRDTWIKSSAITRIERGKISSTSDATLGGSKYECTFVGMMGEENWIFVDESVEAILRQLDKI